MKKIILGLIGIMGLMSCQKQKDCKHWTMVVEDQQMQLDEANLNYMQNHSEENLSKIKTIKISLDNSIRIKQQNCN